MTSLASFTVWKICVQTSSGGVCPVGSTIIQPVVALVGSFVLTGLFGLLYLASRGRRGG
jgi:hypothetical protein